VAAVQARALMAALLRLKSTAAAHLVLRHRANVLRLRHSACARAFAPLPETGAALLREHLLRAAEGGSPAVPRLPPPPAAPVSTWRALAVLLRVKVRVPAWVVAAVDNSADIYELGSSPGHTPGPPAALLAALALPALTLPLAPWVAALSDRHRAILYLLTHANRERRRLRVSAGSGGTGTAVVCTRCFTLLSPHAGLPPARGRGCVIDARGGAPRCSACRSAALTVLPLAGRSFTVAVPGGTAALAACPRCGTHHRLAGPGPCEACRPPAAPATCICRRPSKAATVPFVCYVNGTIVQRWVCQHHVTELPRALEDLGAIKRKLNIRE
jgi:hypothetical protein